ncbi:MAG: L-fucose/L-arabinose isomerase family protein [Nitrososphaeria archaeon]
MTKIRIGFVPLHRKGFDEKWAVDMKNRVIKASEKFDAMKLIYPDSSITNLGLVCDEMEARKTIHLFKEKDVDGILLGTMNFGDELAGVTVAEAFKGYPLMVFGTKEPETKPIGFKSSNSFCGTLSLASDLHRRKMPFVFSGVVFPEEKAFLKSLENFMRVIAIVRSFVGARVGLVGPRPEGFETVTYDESVMAELYKQRVVHTTVSSIIEEARKLDDEDPDVIRTLEDMKAVNIAEVPRDALAKMAKLEVALRNLVNEKSLDGMGIRCWTEIENYYGIFPCFTMGRLTQSGIMTSCEADVYGVLTMLMQYKASLETSPPHFIDWTIVNPKEPNVFLAWHCGNAPPNLSCSTSPSAVTYHDGFFKSTGIKYYGTLNTILRPGTVTLCRLAEYGGQFKMLITMGEIVEMNDELSKEALKAGSAAWVKVADLDRLFRTLVREGFVHHASMIHGDYGECIKQACMLLGIEVIEV